MRIVFGFIIILLPLLICAGCFRTSQESLLQATFEAQTAFEEAEKASLEEQPKKFRRVAAMFQEIINRGIQSGPIYYNLGNAWFRAEEPGLALAAYYSAQRYMPLDPHIASNIQIVLSTSAPLKPTVPVIEYVFFWQDWIGCREKVLCSIILAITAFVSGLLCLWIRYRRLRRIAWMLLMLTFISVCSTGYDWYRFEWVRHAVIALDGAIPRKGNSEQYEPVFTTPVPFGTTAVVLDERTDWIRLYFPSSQDGWLPKAEIVEY
jgi:hypothetical protein